MSDALTDMARDERRNARMLEWLLCIADYIEGLVEFDAVVKAAEECDAVRRGYWYGQTGLVAETHRIVPQLKAGDATTKAKFLASLGDSCVLDRLRGLLALPEAPNAP